VTLLLKRCLPQPRIALELVTDSLIKVTWSHMLGENSKCADEELENIFFVACIKQIFCTYLEEFQHNSPTSGLSRSPEFKLTTLRTVTEVMLKERSKTT
jgi:hypothetical protein